MSLLDTVLDHFRRRAAPLAADRDGRPVDLEVQAATAVLLLEAAYGDTEYVWREEKAIRRGLEQAFGLGARETRQVLGSADEIRPPAVTLSDVTEVLRSRYDLEQRKQVLALLWKVIDADRVLQDWEKSFVQHVTRALELTEEQSLQARALARGNAAAR